MVKDPLDSGCENGSSLCVLHALIIEYIENGGRHVAINFM